MKKGFVIKFTHRNIADIHFDGKDIIIYRIIQEALTNTIKHAEAKQTEITLNHKDGKVSLTIKDDGKGFDPKINKGGRGLKNIVTRSLWLKGNINIDSTPGRGTTITTEFPV